MLVMYQITKVLCLLPAGSGLQSESRDEELIYLGSVAGLHIWKSHKNIKKLEELYLLMAI